MSKALVSSLLTFDLICYHSILAFAYNTNESIDRIAKENYSFRYECIMKEVFDQFHRKMGTKIAKLRKYIQLKQLEVVFIQGLSSKCLALLLDNMRGYRISHKQAHRGHIFSAIMISEELVNQLEPLNHHQQLQKFNIPYL